MITRSLRWRLLLGAIAAILVALAVAWGFMTLLFERHLERRLQAEMTRDALAVVAALTLSPEGRPSVQATLPDPRLQAPAGGYYWQVTAPAGAARSRSLWDAELPVPADAPADDWRLRRSAGPFGPSLVMIERRLVLDEGGTAVTVQMAQDGAALQNARDEFARELALFLGVLWVVLSTAAWVQVALGLRPLRRIRGDLDSLRDSARQRLPEASLSEVQPLVDAINALADAREREIEGARRRAADLAHGLKTPLAALVAQSRRAREAGATAAADGMDRGIAAISTTIDAELARARIAAVGHAGRGERADIALITERLVNVLEHTPRGGELAFALDVPVGLTLAMPPEPLSELLGAVLENAVRHARRQVRVAAHATEGELRLSVEDDGPGIPGEQVREALARGGRLDQTGSGSGLGLAIARELVEATGGSITLGVSTLGGLCVSFVWPVGGDRAGA